MKEELNEATLHVLLPCTHSRWSLIQTAVIQTAKAMVAHCYVFTGRKRATNSTMHQTVIVHALLTVPHVQYSIYTSGMYLTTVCG